MDYLPFLVFALLGLFVLAMLWAVVALLARSAGAVTAAITKRDPRSPAYARAVSRLVTAGLMLFIGHTAYTAAYPPDEFYAAEFEAASSRELPKGARILAKDASYPDFHGDYCSFSRIRLDRQSFGQLLQALSADTRMRVSDGADHVSEGATPGMKLPALGVAKLVVRNDTKIDHHRTISFLDNGTDIEVQVCVT